jgi:hypothetical protein
MASQVVFNFGMLVIPQCKALTELAHCLVLLTLVNSIVELKNMKRLLDIHFAIIVGWFTTNVKFILYQVELRQIPFRQSTLAADGNLLTSHFF